MKNVNTQVLNGICAKIGGKGKNETSKAGKTATRRFVRLTLRAVFVRRTHGMRREEGRGQFVAGRLQYGEQRPFERFGHQRPLGQRFGKRLAERLRGRLGQRFRRRFGQRFGKRRIDERACAVDC